MRERLVLAVALQAAPAAGDTAPGTLDRDLRQLARLVGEVRDRDVGARLLRPPEGSVGTPGLAAIVSTLKGELASEGRIGRKLLWAKARAALDSGLPGRIHDWLAGVAGSPASRWTDALRQERSKRVARVVNAVDAVHRKSSVPRLHRLRRRLRALRFLDESFPARRLPASFPASLRRWHRLVGSLHDTFVLEGRLGRLEGLPEVQPWAVDVRRRRKAQKAQALRQLEGRPFRRALKEALREPVLAHDPATSERRKARAQP